MNVIHSLTVSDFNNGTRLDIGVVYSDINTVGVLLGYGNGSFVQRTTLEIDITSQSYSVAIDDFNDDAILDLILANYDTNNIIRFLGDGSGTFLRAKEVCLGYESHPFSTLPGHFDNNNFST